MSDHKRGEERIMRVTEIDGERTSWVDEGELVRCDGCVNWGRWTTCTRPTTAPWCASARARTTGAAGARVKEAADDLPD